MLKNYVKTAIRFIVKFKGYSIINISGLAVGMACFILILLYVRYELSYDNFQKDGDRIFRVIQRQPGNTFVGKDIFAVTQGTIAPAMMENFPEVLYATRFDRVNESLISNEEAGFYEDGVVADENFLNVFSFELSAGDRKNCLTEPNQIIISEKLAQKFFKEENPIGKILKVYNKFTVTITGIHKNVPDNSHFKFDFILSLKTRLLIPSAQENLNNWNNSSYLTYFLLKEGFGWKHLGKKIFELYKENSGKADAKRIYMVQPLKDIHLRSSDITFDMAEVTDIKNLYLFSLVGIVILIIACINYMNLATARSSNRAKEIGIRKTAGAFRGQLIRQYSFESVILSLIALFSALILVFLILPFFRMFFEKNIYFSLNTDFGLLAALVFFAVLVGFVSGSYPALVLSSFKPSIVLKTGLLSLKKGSYLRNFLVISQFCSSVILITVTIIIYLQYQYLKNKDLGLKKDHIIYTLINQAGAFDKVPAIKGELLKHPGIISVSISSFLPTGIGSNTSVKAETVDGNMTEIDRIYRCYVDFNYIDHYELKIKYGRKFSPDFETDAANAVIINEETANLMGWKDPVGKKITLWNKYNYTVIGVLKNFHFYSLKEKISPVMLNIMTDQWQNWLRFLSIKVRPENLNASTAYLTKIMKKHFPEYPVVYRFLNETYYNTYASEKKLGQMLGYFSFLAVFISCLGLFGLASYKAERRTKEIGIRKTLGATVTNIIILLSKEFTKYVFFAFVVGTPAAYYIMNKWLQNFAYHTNISIQVFLFSGIVVLFTALVSVGYQSIKAALKNPIDTLKYE